MKKAILLLALLTSVSFSFAQSELNLAQCEEIALENNRQIKAAGYKTYAARQTSLGMKGNFFPEFRFSVTGLYSTMNESLKIEGGNLPVLAPSATSPTGMAPTGEFAYFPGLSIDFKMRELFNSGVTLEQPIYAGGKISAAYRLSKLGVEIAQQNERLTKTEVIVSTDNAYANAVKAAELEKVAVKYHDALQELYRNIESALRNGMATRNDLLKVQVKLNDAQLKLMKARNAIRLARINLCHTIGLPLDSNIVVSSAWPEVAVPSDILMDISARPEYDMLNMQVKAASEEVKIQRANQLPQIGVVANYGYTYGAKINDQRLFNSTGSNVMVTLSVPIFHFGKYSHELKSAKYKEEQLREEQRYRNELMYLEATQAANNLAEAQLECQVAEKSLEQAAENMRISGKSYELGEETLGDYLESQVLWQQAWQEKVESQYKLYIAFVEYKRASGNFVVEREL